MVEADILIKRGADRATVAGQSAAGRAWIRSELSRVELSQTTIANEFVNDMLAAIEQAGLKVYVT